VDKIFMKIFAMISIIIVDIFVVPYLLGVASTLFMVGGYLLVILSIYTEIKIIMSFFKKESK